VKKRSPTEFSNDIQNILRDLFEINQIIVERHGRVIYKSRCLLDNQTFIQIFYNQTQPKISAQLIRKERRIFGIDNQNEWHIHPLKQPENHQNTEPHSLKEILREIKGAYESI